MEEAEILDMSIDSEDHFRRRDRSPGSACKPARAVTRQPDDRRFFKQRNLRREALREPANIVRRLDHRGARREQAAEVVARARDVEHLGRVDRTVALAYARERLRVIVVELEAA